MAATYIQPTLADFEQVFGSLKHKKTGKSMFTLCSPSKGKELFYEGTLQETSLGRLCVQVWTSVASDSSGARDCGKDAIRCSLVWRDVEGFDRALGKTRRVNRSAGDGKTAKDIVERALERARELARRRFPACLKCGRPMAVRTARTSQKQFWGCVGYPSCDGTRWDKPTE